MLHVITYASNSVIATKPTVSCSSCVLNLMLQNAVVPYHIDMVFMTLCINQSFYSRYFLNLGLQKAQLLLWIVSNNTLFSTLGCRARGCTSYKTHRELYFIT